MQYLKKYFVSGLFALLVLGAVFFSGEYVGMRESSASRVPETITNADNGKASNVDFSPFWKVWNTLGEKYVKTATTTEKITDQDKVWGAINGLVSSLGDPYTVFFPPAESQIFAEEISGNFEGVGMEVGIKNGVITVVSPLKGTPAAQAGILAGDVILEINGKLTAGMNVDEAVKLIRGKVGTSVVLTIKRENQKEPVKIKVFRDVINIPTIDTEILPSGIFLIRLYNFSAMSPDLFRKALREFIGSGSDGLILDLRGNPGGYLEAAIDIASWFLPAGDVVVKEDFGGNTEPTIYRSKGYDIFTDKLKLAILIDGGSASASEILAGALRENGRAALIGEKTFGKGSVQELLPVTSDTSLKITIAKWLTPNGTSISEAGLTPDIVIVGTEDDFKNGKDPQLAKAVEYLLKK